MNKQRTSKRSWIRWIDPEVGVASHECPHCGYILVTLDPPDRCPRCGEEPEGVVRGEE